MIALRAAITALLNEPRHRPPAHRALGLASLLGIAPVGSQLLFRHQLGHGIIEYMDCTSSAIDDRNSLGLGGSKSVGAAGVREALLSTTAAGEDEPERQHQWKSVSDDCFGFRVSRNGNA